MTQNSENLPDDVWLIRECDIYKEEYDTCKSRKGRRHQWYTLGCKLDCSKWEDDYKNCLLYTKSNDVEAANKIIENEKERYFARRKASLGNNMWEYRDSPPEDWNKPVPGWENKVSLFKAYNMGKKPIPQEEERSSCTIL
ncbi:Hypothetical predicted protein [Mytilus galloprovincialis]|uniref:Synaptic plasticity regulator PANTS n=1 Tax=Mytilus galloprovincialis TaxID=29158 RepID=A0A8B6C5Z0_MYTGA|nr:Hypothetical predicted protein [Mytilus galloprovincialis]